MSNLNKIFKKLSVMDRLILSNHIEAVSKEIVNKLAEELQMCMLAALTLNFELLTYTDLQKIINQSIELREDQVDKLLELKKQHGKELSVYMEKISQDLVKRINQLLHEKVSQAKAIKVLTKEFKDIPTTNIVKAYKSLKDEYVPPNQVEKPTSPVESVELNKKEVEVHNMNNRSIIDSENKTPKFKVTNRILDIQGEFDKYHIKNNVVSSSKCTFESIQDINNTYDKIIENLEIQIEKLKKEKSECIDVFNEYVVEEGN
ncbi:MAG: hypothetical protein QXG00_07875 [Candidatus Woesearchaeota archaeon]